MLRNSPNSLVPLPACGSIAASISAPVDKQITPTTRASGKPTPGRLRARLRIAGLIRRRIRHRDPGAIDQFHRAPAPGRKRLGTEHLSALPSQRADHLNRQALTRLAVSPGIDALHTQAFRSEE